MNKKKDKQVESEFSRFDKVMGKLLRVPHSEIKEKLEVEKAEKKKRKVLYFQDHGTKGGEGA